MALKAAMIDFQDKEQDEKEDMYLRVLKTNKGGFNYDLCNRNERLIAANIVPAHKLIKTGTTTCGIVVKDGVILATDTRATVGDIIAEKKCRKISLLADNLAVAGSGGSADIHFQAVMLASDLELLRLAQNGRKPRAISAVKRLTSKFFQYQGGIHAAYILGGYDHFGPQLFVVHPHGSSEKLPYAAGGSGTLAAIGVIEKFYKDDLSVEEGKQILIKAVRAGIFNDLASGGCVDLCVLTKDGTTMHFEADIPAPRSFKATYKPFPAGTTPISKQDIHRLVVVEDVEMREI